MREYLSSKLLSGSSAIDIAASCTPVRVVACDNRFGADFRPLCSCRGQQATLKRSHRSDSVIRDWPVALRVRAVQNKTRNGPLHVGLHERRVRAVRLLREGVGPRPRPAAGARLQLAAVGAGRQLIYAAGPPCIILGRISGLFPPVVAHRLLSSSPSAAIS